MACIIKWRIRFTNLGGQCELYNKNKAHRAEKDQGNADGLLGLKRNLLS